MGNELFEVGEYIQAFNEATGQSIPCGKIYQSNGLQIHVDRHHPEESHLVGYVSEIIKAPEYVGKHPREHDSIELVKQIDGNVMVCIKLDHRNGYLYVASVFTISPGKLNNRLNSGRLTRY